mmetsp:Transcript_6490/g.19351  ORF Transcript_6490/g.19351 Transcript_6490/m.19351 type:complete len:203 (-) Transcript_6490:534-1142(-)
MGFKKTSSVLFEVFSANFVNTNIKSTQDQRLISLFSPFGGKHVTPNSHSIKLGSTAKTAALNSFICVDCNSLGQMIPSPTTACAGNGLPAPLRYISTNLEKKLKYGGKDPCSAATFICCKLDSKSGLNSTSNPLENISLSGSFSRKLKIASFKCITTLSLQSNSGCVSLTASATASMFQVFALFAASVGGGKPIAEAKSAND